jgi:hypothetical protein
LRQNLVDDEVVPARKSRKEYVYKQKKSHLQNDAANIDMFAEMMVRSYLHNQKKKKIRRVVFNRV